MNDLEAELVEVTEGVLVADEVEVAVVDREGLTEAVYDSVTEADVVAVVV